MKSCGRCGGAIPAGFRFCNYCGASTGLRRDAGGSESGVVFGNLALAPETQPGPETPEPAPRSDSLARVKTLAGGLPAAALDLAAAAGRAARHAAVQAASMARSLVPRRGEGPDPAAGQGAPESAVSPEPTSRPAAIPAAPDLKAAHALYLKGREAYDKGDRPQAARYFVAASRLAPPDSPLAKFLARIVKPAKAPPPPTPPPVAPPPRLAVLPGGAPLGPRPAPAPPSSPLRVVRASPAPAEAAEAPAPLRPTAGARMQAVERWVESLPPEGPSRPSLRLDETEPGRALEVAASGAVLLAAVAFLALLVL